MQPYPGGTFRQAGIFGYSVVWPAAFALAQRAFAAAAIFARPAALIVRFGFTVTAGLAALILAALQPAITAFSGIMQNPRQTIASNTAARDTETVIKLRKHKAVFGNEGRPLIFNHEYAKAHRRKRCARINTN